MFNEYDMVDLVTGPPDFPAGTDGVILFVYDAHPPAYEVEFTAPDGTNLGTHTVRGEQLQLRKSGDNNGSR